MKKESVYSNSISSPFLAVKDNSDKKREKSSSKNDSKTDPKKSKARESANKL